MAYDYQSALKAGASEDQVLDYLTKTRKYDVQGAVNAGASKTQVIDYLSKNDSPVVSAEKIKTPEIEESEQSKDQSIWETNPYLKTITGGVKIDKNDTAIDTALKTAANVPSSGINFIKGLVNSVNPIETIKQVNRAKEEATAAKNEGVNPLDVVKEIPGAAYETLVPEFMKSIVKGDWEGMKKSLVEDPVGQIAPLVLVKGKQTLNKSIAKEKTIWNKGLDAATKNPKANAINATGKIVQGDIVSAPEAAKVLSNIDTKKVRTYQDLSSVLDKDIKAKITQVDNAYNSVSTKTKLNNLNQTVSSAIGDKTISVKVNYVRDSLKQLEELYKITKQPAEQARIKTLAKKASSEGLAPNEINGIAREYGTEFKSKAFNKIGDPLTSVNAQAFENTRKGLKNTARSFLPDETSKILDQKISETLNTKLLIDKMAENVNRLQQRVQARGTVEKISRGLAGIIDMVTLGGPKAFIAKLLFPSNVGLKTLNSLDLQEQLSKNLKIVQDLNKTPDSLFSNKVINFVRNRINK